MNSSDIQVPGYTIHSAIGHGGMASVFLATQESLNRKVAIKVLRNRDETGVGERFINEARYIASLNSPHVITIYDISTLENGDCYIAMEFIACGDLTENFENISGVEAALEVIRQVALGLVVVHDSGIIHRDVKPKNILFRKDGTAVLTDFGIAKEIDNASDLTQAGFSLGSPSYSSPEQAQCHPIDLTTDIYSLGVVLLELLLGYNPFKGDSHTGTALNHIQLPVPTLPEEFDHLTPLVQRMLAKSPEERYPSCRELLADIEQILEMEQDAHRAESAKLFPLAPFRRFHLPRIWRLPSWPELKFRRPWFRSSLWAFPAISTKNLRGGLAAMAGSVLIAAVYFGAFYQTETEREIEHLLHRAEQSMEAGRYMAPIADNAHELYRQVLKLEKTNLKAIWGVKTAEQKQVEAYLVQAAQALGDRRLQRPDGDNALHYYRQALAIDAKNARARTGIRDVIQEYIRLARTEMSESDYSEANYYVDSGLNIAPNNALLLSLRDELERRQEQVLVRQREQPQRRPAKTREETPTVRTYIRSALDKLRDKLGGN